MDRTHPSRRPTRPRLVAFTAALVTAVGWAAPARLAAQDTSKDYTPADADFMQGMIIHHAQAVVMSNWAPTHDASAAVQLLTRRIALSQEDEIALMQRWLTDRGLPAPDPLHMMRGDTGQVVDTSPLHMPGMDMGPHPMMMSGMLSPHEMRVLDAARGERFDSLYLVGMIKHHQGALDMVQDLFAKPGAGQQPEISVFATDIDASQRAQITRMETLLNAMNPGHER